MNNRAFVPGDFVVPVNLVTPQFRLEPPGTGCSPATGSTCASWRGIRGCGSTATARSTA
ncbi:hypothetical protein [Nonomuraea sp. KM88]|uniref:hypothetical protein n=1 Tax=Nonomuraea sp. KM88 TaxID=3457427 RepID=UPI003FCDB7B4